MIPTLDKIMAPMRAITHPVSLEPIFVFCSKYTARVAIAAMIANNAHVLSALISE
jgi:hypothetical protein